jgi:hypothetical protein
MLKDKASVYTAKSREDFAIGFAFPGSFTNQSRSNQYVSKSQQQMMAESLDFSRSNLGESKMDPLAQTKSSMIGANNDLGTNNEIKSPSRDQNYFKFEKY